MTLPEEELHGVTHSTGSLSSSALAMKADVQHKTPYDRHEELVWLWEPPPARGVLTQDGITQIAFHKYTPGSYTWLDLKLNPIWTGLTECLPMHMAPNLVTALGGLHCLVSYLITWTAMPDFSSSPPTWIFVLNFYCNVVYYTLDCMDGKQARRTNSSSPLGQLFDHGVDCLCLLTHLSMVQAWYQAPPRTYAIIQASLQYSFFVAQWEEYYTGVLPHATGNIGVTEVNYGLAVASLVNAFFDRDKVYSTPLRELCYQHLPTRLVDILLAPVLDFTNIVQLRDLMAVGWYCMVSTLVILSISRVCKHVTPRQRILAVLKHATPAFMCVAIQVIPDDILQTELRFISLVFGLTICLITIKLIVFSMARQAYSIVQWDALPLILAIGATNDSRWTPLGMTRLWQTLCVWYVFRIIQWNHSAIEQICNRLNIQLFVIKTKQV